MTDEYYFLLGKKGSPQKRFMESFESAQRDLGIKTLMEDVNSLEKKIHFLKEHILNDNLIEYFKKQFILKLETRSYRFDELIYGDYYLFKQSAYSQLVKEEKIFRTNNGWVKLSKKA